MACHILEALEGVIFSVPGWSLNTNVGCVQVTRLPEKHPVVGHCPQWIYPDFLSHIHGLEGESFRWCGDLRVLFVGLAPEPCVHLCGSDTDRKHLISLRHSLPQG